MDVRNSWQAVAIGSVLLALLACASPAPSASTAPQVRLEPLNGVPGRLGKLELVAAFELESRDDRFGGLSALLIEGERLTALSDRANLWTARLRYRGDGALVGMEDWRVEPVGAVDRARSLDTESLARMPDGSLIAVSETPARPLVLEGRMPPGLKRLEATFADLPVNEGIEAMATLPGGAVLTLAEAADQDGLHRTAIFDGNGVTKLRYRTASGFAPTSADVADGVVYVVERRLSLLGGLEGRVVALDASLLREGAVVQGIELARLGPGNIPENFEGIAAHATAAGAMIYMVSDDNFNPLQRTLLLQLLWRRNDSGTGSM